MKKLKQSHAGGRVTDPRMEVAGLWVFGVLLFLSVTVTTGWMSVALSAAAILSALLAGKGGTERVWDRFWPALGLVLFAIINGAAAIYSPFDETAVSEFYKIIAALSLAAILIVRAEKKHVRGLLWGIAAVCAAISLLSIDHACDGVLFKIFKSAAELLGGSYSNMEDAGSRVGGLYNNANVFAGIVSVGAVAALYLADSETEAKKTVPAWLLVGICVQGLMLSASRGGLLCFGLGLAVWLIAAEKAARVRLLFKMLIAAAAAGAASVIAASAVRSAAPWLALAVTLLTGAAIWGLDLVLGKRLTAALSGREKLMTVTLVAVLALCVGYAVAALSIKGAYTFDESGHLRREIALDAGEYTVSGDWDGEITVWVSTENGEQLFTDSGEIVYSGLLEDAAFAVPEGTKQVTFGISAQPGTVLRELILSDGTEIPLDYPLVPGFLKARVQGNLLMDSSFLLRVQYVKDAWTLFAQKPLLGHGLGSTENLYSAIQPFRYESRYAHNHVVQYMSDMGLFGLLSFLMMALSVTVLLVLQLRRERNVQTAMLLGGWLMINAHSLMEINFSVRAYQCVAMAFFAVAAVACERPPEAKFFKKGGAALRGVLCLYFAVFFVLLAAHRSVLKASEKVSVPSWSAYMETLKGYVRKDVFNNAQHKLNFVGNAVLDEELRYGAEMERWAEDLRQSGTYTNCSGLARYYYLPRGEYEELFACSREGIAQVASSPDGWNLQMNFYRGDVLAAIDPQDVGVYLEGVLALKNYLDTYNAEHLNEILLTEKNENFVTFAETLQNSAADPEVIYMALMTAAAD